MPMDPTEEVKLYINKKTQGILIQFIKTGTECVVNDKNSNGDFS